MAPELRGCGLGLMAVVLLATPAMAQRSRDYTPSQFVSALNGLGYPVKLTDTVETPIVRQAIRDFQRRYNLPVTGTMTPASQDQAAALVKALQQNLNQVLKPSPALPQNQYYGAQTESFIKVFQSRNRLPVTGIATLEIRSRLAQALLNSGPPQAVPAVSQSNARPLATNASSVIPPIPPAPEPPTAAAPVAAPPLPAVVAPLPVAPRRPVMVAPVQTFATPRPNVKFGRLYTELEFRRVLQGLGYDINPTKFLSDTSAVVAIQDFQARYGLALTGAADQPTQAMVRKILRVLQYNLQLVSDRPVAITEFYDDATSASVRAFQQRNKLRVDGLATVSVRRAIDNQAKRRLIK
ncbi:peptidoglycan-binding protein [filamentous cyanobacterium LEGE 11480]|uniref:Peptidoglycan-binding protein n=1 Tax=Romeriopsis navalis LEGE 11480 TaxID=2777977 RepID=A0A928VL09_9CYAN|nr:peptidoglycan-binding domain-containing protein [Romeriopsis navalis]MBE9029678.1 peptidoglycan-binding protein [Romeriopsis navalis LEGE 11480]